MTLGTRMAETAVRLLAIYGTDREFFSDDTTSLGTFKAVETKFVRDLADRGLIQENDQVYWVARVCEVGELLEIDGDKLYISFTENKRLQGTDIISRVIVQK